MHVCMCDIMPGSDSKTLKHVIFIFNETYFFGKDNEKRLKQGLKLSIPKLLASFNHLRTKNMECSYKFKPLVLDFEIQMWQKPSGKALRAMCRRQGPTYRIQNVAENNHWPNVQWCWLVLGIFFQFTLAKNIVVNVPDGAKKRLCCYFIKKVQQILCRSNRIVSSFRRLLIYSYSNTSDQRHFPASLQGWNLVIAAET